MNDATVVEESPNRENVKIVVMRTPVELEKTLFGLVDNLSVMENDFPRTLIYCNSIQDVCRVYHYLTSEVKSTDTINVIEMYHSETPADKKEFIVSNLGKESNLKVVIATSALGMGVDVHQCYNTILYGPPKDIVDLLQESGRCGRDGTPSVCVVLCNRYQIGHLSDPVKDMIKCTDCRRKSILSNFTADDHFVKNHHTCCDLCALRCTCGSCDSLPIEIYLKQCTPECDEVVSSSDSDTISYEYESD